MRVDGRPLLDTAVDADLFVGRSREVERLLRAVALGLNAAVTGGRGIGKSSLLRHVAWCLRRREVEIVQLPAADAADARDLLVRLLRRLAGDEVAAVATLAGLDAHGLIDRIGQVTGQAGGRAARTVVLVDDLPLPVGRAVFGALRDEVWRLEITWLAAVGGGAAEALLRAPVDAFFELVVPLGPLTREQSVEVLRRRTADAIADRDAGRLADLAEGHPRKLIDAARVVVVDGEPVDELEARDEVRRERLATVSSAAADLVIELESLGPAGPSDPLLQQRMAVSRPRLVALFGELRDAGLVREVAPERGPGGPGRPRTRFTLTDR